MKASDVMVTNVITVDAGACVQDVAGVLLDCRISAVPVVEPNGKLVGIVSEGDLMRRAEAGTGRTRPWWLGLPVGKEVPATEFVKENSGKVVDVMTRDVVTAGPETPLSTIANLLEKTAVKRVPIVEAGKVVGIVSRANLLQALASSDKQTEVSTPINDSKVREKVLKQLSAGPWTRRPSINVSVQDGTVELWGIVDSASEKNALRMAAEVTPGVRAVNDNLLIARWDRDTRCSRNG